MSRRCGGANGCGCEVQGGPGIAVGGLGTPNNPYVVSFVGGDTACGIIMDCVGDHLGNGLVFNTVTNEIAIGISEDPDNQASIGTDSLLYVGSGAAGTGGVSVAGLPAGPMPTAPVIGGLRGVSFLYPENTVQGAAFARDLPLISMVHIDVRCLKDGTLIAATSSDLNRMSPGAGNLYEQNRMRMERLGYSSYGDFNWAQPDYVPSDPLIDRHRIDPVRYASVDDILARVGRQIVLVLHMPDPGVGNPTAGTRLMSAITRHSLQKSVIVTATTLGELAPFISAGIETGLWLGTQAAATANPASSITTAGAKWVFCDRTINDATFTAYKNAGLAVMAMPVDRHNAPGLGRTRFEALGIRGFLSGDPIYASGQTAYYRETSNQFWQGMGGMYAGVEYGWLSEGTDTANASGYLGATVRGEIDLANDSWKIPANTGGQPFLLQGMLCPIATPTSYSIEFWVKFASLPAATFAWLGICFAVPTDHSMGPGSRGAIAADQYYNLRIHYNAAAAGSLEMYRCDGAAGLTLLHNTASWGSGNAATNTFYGFKISVTPTQIKYGPQSDPSRVVLNDATYRGPYLHLGKEEFGQQFTGNFGVVNIGAAY